MLHLLTVVRLPQNQTFPLRKLPLIDSDSFRSQVLQRINVLEKPSAENVDWTRSNRKVRLNCELVLLEQ